MAKPKNNHPPKDAPKPDLESPAEPSPSLEMVEASASPEIQADDYAKHPKFAKFKSTQGEN